MQKIISLLIFLIISTNVNASLIEEATSYYESKDYKKALPVLTGLANAGNPKAQGFLSRMYLIGLGGSVNYKTSLMWASKGALKDDVISELTLAELFENGYGLSKIDKNEAKKWLKRAIDQGGLMSILEMAFTYYEDNKYKESIKLYELIFNNNLIKQGGASDETYANRKGYSAYMLGYIYSTGIKDSTLATKWYKKAIEEKDLRSHIDLAIMYMDEKKYNEAVKLLEIICKDTIEFKTVGSDGKELYKNKTGIASGILGNIYEYDDIDLYKATLWYKKGVEDLDLNSYIGLASVNFKQKRYKEAILLYEKIVNDNKKTLKKGMLSPEFYTNIKGLIASDLADVYDDFKEEPDHIELSKKWDSKAMEYGYVENARIGGAKKAQDLINEGWLYFIGEGEGKVVNEPFAQYFTEEGLRIALRIKDKYMISLARNNLGVILGASVNKNIRNNRLANIHLYDGLESEYAPNNLLWSYYEGDILLKDTEVNDLRNRYLIEFKKQHPIFSIEPIPVNIKGSSSETLGFLIKQFNIHKNYELAEEIADYIEDNSDKLELKTALIWMQKAAHLKNVSYKDDVRYTRIEKILAGKYIKDMPETSSVKNTTYELNPVVEKPSEEKKLKLFALVIGNSKYKDKPLDNATNDSDAITNKLKNIGFQVTEINNLSRKEFNKSIIEFTEKSVDSDVTLLFYSGHGVQLGGVNYLLPVDIDFNESEEIVTYEGISLNDLLRRSIIGKTRVVFIDACRTNPFKTTQARGSSEGLAPINAPRGTLISYATRDGGVAYDGSGKENSPYTSALIKHLDDNLDVALMLRSVRDEVLAETKDKQEPWEYGSLSGGQLILSKLAK